MSDSSEDSESSSEAFDDIDQGDSDSVNLQVEQEGINLGIDPSEVSNELDSDGEAGPIVCDFDFCDPKEDDYHMVKSLLLQGTAGLVESFKQNLLDISDDVCAQAACGTTITVDSDVYAFVSALSEKHYADRSYMKSIIQLLESTCPAEHSSQLEKIRNSGLALLITERLMNMPNEVIPPLYASIVDDIEWSNNNVKETGGNSDMFDFQYVTFLAPCYLSEQLRNLEDMDKEDVFSSDSDSDSDCVKSTLDAQKSGRSNGKRTKNAKLDSKSKKAKKQSSKGSSNSGVNDAACLYFEQQLMVKKSALAFVIELCTPKVLEGKAKGAVPQRHKPRHAVLGVISLKSLKESVNEMQKMVDKSDSKATLLTK